MAMGVAKNGIFGIIFACIIAFVWRYCSFLDVNKVAYSHTPGICRHVDPITDGSEDIALLPDGQVVLTTGLRYTASNELKGVTGRLFYYKFGQSKAEQVKIKWTDEKLKIFNPHGMKPFVDQKGTIYLYVVNHEPHADNIEIFEYDPKVNMAVHMKTINHELIFNPNNLAIIDKEEFFVSNDAYFKNSFLKNLEFMLPLFKLGSIVYYNKGKARNADSFLFMPNGLSVDKQKKHLFVGSIITKQLWVYNIDKDRNIVRTKSIDVGAMIDNVFYDDHKNTVWLGCHPISHLVASHLGHPKTVSAPSLVLAVEFTDKQMNNYTIKDYYADDGKQLWASTVAVPYQNQLLIGTITDRLMLCDMPGYQNTPHLA